LQQLERSKKEKKVPEWTVASNSEKGERKVAGGHRTEAFLQISRQSLPKKLTIKGKVQARKEASSFSRSWKKRSLSRNAKHVKEKLNVALQKYSRKKKGEKRLKRIRSKGRSRQKGGGGRELFQQGMRFPSSGRRKVS